MESNQCSYKEWTQIGFYFIKCKKHNLYFSKIRTVKLVRTSSVEICLCTESSVAALASQGSCIQRQRPKKKEKIFVVVIIWSLHPSTITLEVCGCCFWRHAVSMVCHFLAVFWCCSPYWKHFHPLIQ